MNLADIFSSFLNRCTNQHKKLISAYIYDSQNPGNSMSGIASKYGLNTKKGNYFDYYEKIIDEEGFDFILAQDCVKFFTKTVFLRKYFFEISFTYNISAIRNEVHFNIFRQDKTEENFAVSFYENENGDLILDNGTKTPTLKFNSMYLTELKNSSFNYYVFNFDKIIKTVLNNYNTPETISDTLLLNHDIHSESDDILKAINEHSYIYKNLP